MSARKCTSCSKPLKGHSYPWGKNCSRTMSKNCEQVNGEQSAPLLEATHADTAPAAEDANTPQASGSTSVSQSTEEIEKLLKEAEAERRELLVRKKNRELLLQLQSVQAENAMLQESLKDPGLLYRRQHRWRRDRHHKPYQWLRRNLLINPDWITLVWQFRRLWRRRRTRLYRI